MKPTAPWRSPAVQKSIRRYMLLMLLLLVPVFVIALFNRPSADDFGYSTLTRATLQQGGAAAMLRTAWEENLFYYQTWNGTYISSFLATLQPGIFGSKWYALTTFLVIIPLFLCLWGAARLILGRLLPQSRGLAAPAALLTLLMLVEGMPNQVQALFWYDGIAFYQPFFALTVLNAGLAFALAWDNGVPRGQCCALLAAGCVCSFLIPGGHPTLGLLNAMLQSAAAGLAVLCKGKGGRRNFWLVPMAVVSIAGLLLNVTAPGVGARASGFSSASIPEAVVKSFILAALELVRWADLPLFCFLALLTPLAWWVVQGSRPDLPLFRHFWLAPALTFVLMWGMICLPSYTMGGIGPGRLINIVWMTFVLGTGVSCTAFLGWLVHCQKVDFTAVRSFLARQGRRLHIAAAAALLCICCIGGHTVKEGLDNRFATSLEALWELGQGQPQRFAAAMDARDALLSDPSVTQAVVHPLTEDQQPALLYFSDISPEQDWSIGDYYGKDVTVEYASQ